MWKIIRCIDIIEKCFAIIKCSLIFVLYLRELLIFWQQKIKFLKWILNLLHNLKKYNLQRHKGHSLSQLSINWKDLLVLLEIMLEFMYKEKESFRKWENKNCWLSQLLCLLIKNLLLLVMLKVKYKFSKYKLQDNQ